MARAQRRNISITDEEIDKFLDTQVENVSAYIQEAIRFYRRETEKEYATVADLEALRGEFKIINQNYSQTKIILDEIMEMLFKK